MEILLVDGKLSLPNNGGDYMLDNRYKSIIDLNNDPYRTLYTVHHMFDISDNTNPRNTAGILNVDDLSDRSHTTGVVSYLDPKPLSAGPPLLNFQSAFDVLLQPPLPQHITPSSATVKPPSHQR